MSMLRLFLALETPPGIREHLLRVIAFLQGAAADVRWEPAEKLHATVKFLGDTPEARLGEVTAALERAAAGVAPPAVAYSGLGFFPGPRRPRIVWAGMADATGGVAALHGAIESEMAQLGYAREDRPFRPHVTLGRVRGPRGEAALRARVESCTFDQPPMTLHEVALVRSDLRPSGSVYTTLTRISLSGKPRAGEYSE